MLVRNRPAATPRKRASGPPPAWLKADLTKGGKGLENRLSRCARSGAKYGDRLLSPRWRAIRLVRLPSPCRLGRPTVGPDRFCQLP